MSFAGWSAHTSSLALLWCLAADRDAEVLDFIQFNRRAALNSSIKHSSCSYLPPKDAVPGADDAIHVYPFDLSPQCEVCHARPHCQALRIALAWFHN